MFNNILTLTLFFHVPQHINPNSFMFNNMLFEICMKMPNKMLYL